jgi:hypothetical protein
MNEIDLLIVASTTDLFARAFSQKCVKLGYSVKEMNLETAAGIFSISLENGLATIEPDVRMLLRIPAPAEYDYSFDKAFLDGERFATLFAAAALSKSTVINRPYKGSLTGRCTHSTALTQLRGDMAKIQAEVFSNIYPSPDGRDEGKLWCVQDLGTFHSAPWPSMPPGDGPYRAKWSAEPSYEFVTVVDNKAWRATTVDLEHLQLESTSIALVKRLELRFASVTWAISPCLQYSTLTRVDPYPPVHKVKFVWQEVSTALMELFFG